MSLTRERLNRWCRGRCNCPLFSLAKLPESSRHWTPAFGRDCESTAAPVSCPSMLEPRRPRAAFSDLGESTVPANCGTSRTPANMDGQHERLRLGRGCSVRRQIASSNTTSFRSDRGLSCRQSRVRVPSTPQKEIARTQALSGACFHWFGAMLMTSFADAG